MYFRNARELHEAYEDLERLLALRQAPAIAIELRHKFLAAVLDSNAAVWLAYGYPAAIGLVSALETHLTRYLPPAQLQALLDLLQALQGRPALYHRGAASYSERLDLLIDQLRVVIGEGEKPRVDAQGRMEASIGRSTVAVPVVAELIDPRMAHPLYSGIRVGLLAELNLCAEFSGRPGTGDLLVIDGDVAMDTRAAFAQALILVDRFRAWGGRATHRCVFRARCTPTGMHLTGRSASLGFLLAAATARASHSMAPSHISIAPGTAVTGDLAGTRALPVEPSTFADKIRACMSRLVRQIVVPAQQADEAKRILRTEQRGRYAGTIEIISVSDAAALWATGRAPLRRSRRSIRVFTNQCLDRLTRSRIRMGLVGATAALLTSVLVTWSILRTAPPVSADWEGDTLTLRNEHRLVTQRIELPYAPIHAHHSGIPPHVNRPVADLNGDDKPDVVAIHGSEPDWEDLLTAVDGSGRILWRRRSDQLAPHFVEQPGDMRWSMLFLSPRSGGGAELMALSRSRHGPLSIIGRLDPATGEPIGMLRNYGHLEKYDRICIGEGGRELIAISGTENALGRAIAVLVDADRMRMAESFDPPCDLPATVDKSCLSAGAVAVWSFAVDRFSDVSRTNCLGAYTESDSRAFVDVLVSLNRLRGCMVYEFDASNPIMPTVLRAYFTDATKDIVRTYKGPTTEETFIKEAHRLACEVQTLTPDGWRPARLGQMILPDAPLPVSNEHMREGQRGCVPFPVEFGLAISGVDDVNVAHHAAAVQPSFWS